jgi:pimeloyl-ACP methyl ester carboxylesterase
VRVKVGDVRLWFDVSGPSIVPDGDSFRHRPTLLAVHGGPGLDHLSLKDTLEPLTADLQIVYYDQRGHGRSDYSSAEHWNLRTWAADLRGLCEVLGLEHPIVLGSSFGGFVALAYAGLFPDHPGGLILSNTTGGRTDHARSIEIFRRIGSDEAAAVAQRDFTELTEESAAEFNRICYPLFSAKPGFVEESQKRLHRAIHTTEVNLHYWRNEAPRFDAWKLLEKVTCPALVLAGVDDPICPIELVEELVGGLTKSRTQLVRLDGARHAVFRDQPEVAFSAVREFVVAIDKDRGLPET